MQAEWQLVQSLITDAIFEFRRVKVSRPVIRLLFVTFVSLQVMRTGHSADPSDADAKSHTVRVVRNVDYLGEERAEKLDLYLQECGAVVHVIGEQAGSECIADDTGTILRKCFGDFLRTDVGIESA